MYFVLVFQGKSFSVLLFLPHMYSYLSLSSLKRNGSLYLYICFQLFNGIRNYICYSTNQKKFIYKHECGVVVLCYLKRYSLISFVFFSWFCVIWFTQQKKSVTKTDFVTFSSITLIKKLLSQ